MAWKHNEHRRAHGGVGVRSLLCWDEMEGANRRRHRRSEHVAGSGGRLWAAAVLSQLKTSGWCWWLLCCTSVVSLKNPENMQTSRPLVGSSLAVFQLMTRPKTSGKRERCILDREDPSRTQFRARTRKQELSSRQVTSWTHEAASKYPAVQYKPVNCAAISKNSFCSRHFRLLITYTSGSWTVCIRPPMCFKQNRTSN